MTDKEWKVVRVQGRTVPEMASCDQNGCAWEYEGQKAIAEAKAHTLETGHDSVVWSNVSAWYSRRAAR